MKQLAAFLGFIILVSAISATVRSYKDIKPSPSPLPDSTEPKYRLVMKPAVKASLDSIDMYLLPVIGQSLTVDQANQAKSFLMSQIFRIIQYARPDSVKIEQPKGGKP